MTAKELLLRGTRRGTTVTWPAREKRACEPRREAPSTRLRQRAAVKSHGSEAVASAAASSCSGRHSRATLVHRRCLAHSRCTRRTEGRTNARSPSPPGVGPPEAATGLAPASAAERWDDSGFSAEETGTSDDYGDVGSSVAPPIAVTCAAVISKPLPDAVATQRTPAGTTAQRNGLNVTLRPAL